METNQNFIVRRDGHLDQDWLAEYDAMVRRQQLKEAGHILVDHVRDVSKMVVRGLGVVVVSVVETIEASR